MVRDAGRNEMRDVRLAEEEEMITINTLLQLISRTNIPFTFF